MKTCRYCLKLACEKRNNNNNNEYCSECVTEVEQMIKKIDGGKKDDNS